MLGYRSRSRIIIILLTFLIHILLFIININVLYDRSADTVDKIVTVNHDFSTVPPIRNISDCANSPLLTFPRSTIEDELDRLGKLTDIVMKDLGLTYYPIGATLLGLMRNGRVATDRDVDYNIHVTYETCYSVLNSLKAAFIKRGSVVTYFRVFSGKLRFQNGTKGNRKVGSFAMIRVVREFGTFNTGVDFACVFMDDANGPHFNTDKGILTPIPYGVYPLKKCLMYGRAVPCPGDGYAFLKILTPRYDGCLVYPHCMGKDVNQGNKSCFTPHRIMPLENFVKSTRLLETCGFTSLVKHFETDPICQKEYTPTCYNETGLCFIQKFNG